MRSVVLLSVIFCVPLAAEDIWLSCNVTEIGAKAAEGGVDGKLKKIAKFIEKDETLNKYKSYKFLAKKSLNATKQKAGVVKLKNGTKISVRAIGVDRAQKKNTVTVEVTVGDRSSERRSFIDREYLLVPAGELKAGSDLIVALQCPVFP